MKTNRFIIYQFPGPDEKLPAEIASLMENRGWVVEDALKIDYPDFSLNPYSKSYWTLPLHTAMLRHRIGSGRENPQDDAVLLGITGDKIYVPSLESVLGETYPDHRTIVISTNLLKPVDPKMTEGDKTKLLLTRFEKLLLHEAAHIDGLHHCENPRCPGGRTLSISHLDEKDSSLCEKCLEKRKKILQSAPSGSLKIMKRGKFVYSPGYGIDIGSHVFPVRKYRVMYERLIESGTLSKDDFMEPGMPTWEDLRVALDSEYLDDLREIRLTPATMDSELPLNQEIIDAFRLAAGGTMLAATQALEHGLSINFTGGFHHGYPDHAGGFCYINDIAYTIIKLKRKGIIHKCAVLDCDLHQGNGTAWYFRDDPDIFTFSIHQESNYPPKENGDLDIGLEDGAGDEVHLGKMRRNVPSILEFHQPELVFYLAGGDPYKDDQLGGLKLSLNGLLQRDQMVMEQCWKRNIPLVIVPAGGYANNFEDTVRIHTNTVEAGVGGYLRNK